MIRGKNILGSGRDLPLFNNNQDDTESDDNDDKFPMIGTQAPVAQTSFSGSF